MISSALSLLGTVSCFGSLVVASVLFLCQSEDIVATLVMTVSWTCQPCLCGFLFLKIMKRVFHSLQ